MMVSPASETRKIRQKAKVRPIFFCCWIPVTAQWLCSIHRFVHVLWHSRSVSSFPLFRLRITFLLVWSNSVRMSSIYVPARTWYKYFSGFMLAFARKYLFNNLSCFTTLFGECSLSKFKFRNFNVQDNDSANNLIIGCRANVLWLFTCREIKFSRAYIRVSVLRKRLPLYKPGVAHDFFNG